MSVRTVATRLPYTLHIFRASLQHQIHPSLDVIQYATLEILNAA